MKKNVLLLSIICAVAFWVAAQDPAKAACPRITINGPAGIPDFTKAVIYTAEVSADVERYQPTFVWTASNGEVVDGQGTFKAGVLFKDIRLGMIVSLHVRGLPPDCPGSASKTTFIDFAPTAEKLDEFVGPLSKVTAVRYENIVRRAKANPYAQVYVFMSGGRAGSIRSKRAVLIKQLISKLGHHQNDVYRCGQWQ